MKRPYRHSPVARRAKKSYKSIDAISSPFNGGHQVEVDMGGEDEDDGDEYNLDYEEDEDGEGGNQELTHVYVDSGVPFLSTLLPPPPSKSAGGSKSNKSFSSNRPSSSAASFAFSI